MSEGIRPAELNEPDTPEVFITYSHDSEAHKVRVLELAQRLRSDGVSVWIDQFEEAPAEGWPRWMRNHLAHASFVLVVCTEEYRRRFEGDASSGSGQGANWEGYLTEQMIYADDSRNRRFIPVLLDGTSNSDVPLALQTTTHYRLPRDYARLHRRLTHRISVAPVPIGIERSPSSHPAVVDVQPEFTQTPRSLGRLQAAPQVGLFVHELTGIELLRVPRGAFTMGSPAGEGDRDERPGQPLTVSEFYLARYPVTNGQYARFLAANPNSRDPRFWEPTVTHPNLPVVGVSLVEALTFAEWAGLRLPTEAEWEYACRAGTRTQYYLGNGVDALSKAGWYRGNSACLRDVGGKQPNSFGLHDMHGNVREWCATEYWAYGSREVPSVRFTAIALRGESFKLRCVLRGGAWHDEAEHARAASRYWVRANRRDAAIGFRVARDL